jgi:hypothetical protein
MGSTAGTFLPRVSVGSPRLSWDDGFPRYVGRNVWLAGCSRFCATRRPRRRAPRPARDRFTERFTVQASARRMADVHERVANGTPMAEVMQT